MESIDEYRRKVLRRTYKKDLRIFAVAVAVLALLLVLAVVLPPFMRFLFWILLILFLIPLVLMCDLCVMTFLRLKRWDVAIGSIDEVYLEDEDQTPTIIAKISYKTSDGKIFIHEHDIQCYGDYEEGCEDTVRNMIEEDKKKYENKQVPLFYCPSNPEHCLVMMEDLER